ncbi:MAG: matrixin family metalloprotease [bacterium]|nr:matrixin family metalloprotease [bacterium]
MKRTLNNLFLLLIVGLGIYIYRVPIQAGWMNLYSEYFPCTQPITYSIGAFDERFGISKESFLKSIQKGEALWEAPIGKDVLAYAADGKLKINLVYDYRQEATIKMRALGLSVNDDQASYDSLTSRYKVLKEEFQTRQAGYRTLVAEMERRNAAYNTEVAEWNKKRGAPKDVYERLNEESASLKREVERIRDIEVELRKLQDDINALVTVINQVANNINVSAAEFNKLGTSQGEEFTEGLYMSDRTGQRIDIYQFNDSEKLVRVLAHEFGHALSLEHVEDPKAIMYRLNQGTATTLTPSDIAALKKQCRIK